MSCLCKNLSCTGYQDRNLLNQVEHAYNVLVSSCLGCLKKKKLFYFLACLSYFIASSLSQSVCFYCILMLTEVQYQFIIFFPSVVGIFCWLQRSIRTAFPYVLCVFITCCRFTEAIVFLKTIVLPHLKRLCFTNEYEANYLKAIAGSYACRISINYVPTNTRNCL